MSDYWEQRYVSAGRIWGNAPSRTVEKAGDLFRREGLQRILIPGSGYGRHASYFASCGHFVTGVEISETAVALARKSNHDICYIHGSILDIPLQKDLFDGIFCFNTLHLFLAPDRHALIRKCFYALRPGGLAFFAVFSEQDPSYGKGTQIEKNTFEATPGRPAHYFTEADLFTHFEDFQIVETGLTEDPEEHGAGPHTHILRHVVASKG